MFTVEEDRCLTKDEWDIINSRKSNPPKYPEEYEKFWSNLTEEEKKKIEPSQEELKKLKERYSKPKKLEKIDPTSFGIDEKRENPHKTKIVKQMEGNTELDSDDVMNLSMHAQIFFKSGTPVSGNAYYTYELNNESSKIYENLSKDELSGLKETASQLRSFSEKKGRGNNVATSEEKNLISNLIEQIEKIKI
eukprot:gene10445-2967_t